MSKDREELIEVMREATEAASWNLGARIVRGEKFSTRERYQSFAQATISAIEAAGFVVVPREPTEAMVDNIPPRMHGDELSPQETYRAMINAYSPKTSGGEGE